MSMLLVSSLALWLGACGGQQGAQQSESSSEEPLKVVATYSILGDMVENVGGEEVELTTLVGPNGDAHTFEPAPSDNVKLAEAGVVFENGLGFETWLDDLYESSGSDARRLVATQEVEPLTLAEEEHEEEGEHAEEEHASEHEEEGEHADEEDHAHEHGEFDPHVWFDANNAALMTRSIEDALVKADPENAATYRQNAEEYIAELEELDSWVNEQTEAVPEENRKLVTSHDTFGYFAEAYGYEVAGTALQSFSTEASDASAGETAALVEEIRSAGVPAIFAENVSNSDLMERIASESGVKLAPPLYTDALGEPGSEGDTYVKMMRYDVRTITEALGG